MKRMKLLAAMAVLGIALVPNFASASHNNCNAYIFSGVSLPADNPLTPGLPIRQGLNLGANGNGCTHHAASVDTRIITPGTTSLWAGAPLTLNNVTLGAPSGTITFNSGSPITLSWKKVELPSRNRWESQSLTIPASATKVTLDITQSGNDTTRVVYTRAA